MLADRDYFGEGQGACGVGVHDGLVGKVSKRTLLLNAPIPINTVGDPFAIKLGQAAVVIFQSSPLIISGTAVPLQPGSVREISRSAILTATRPSAVSCRADGTDSGGAMMLRSLLVVLFVALGITEAHRRDPHQGYHGCARCAYQPTRGLWACRRPERHRRQPAQLAFPRAVVAIDAGSDGCQRAPGKSAHKNIAAVLVTADLPPFAGQAHASVLRCLRLAMLLRWPVDHWS